MGTHSYKEDAFKIIMIIDKVHDQMVHKISWAKNNKTKQNKKQMWSMI